MVLDSSIFKSLPLLIAVQRCDTLSVLTVTADAIKMLSHQDLSERSQARCI